MKCVGIIAEYNPFHNGHLYHLEQVRRLFPNDPVVLILGGNFTQRGEPSILDKWAKTKIALEAGVDLVFELPFPFATASSDIFAEGAIKMCDAIGVTDLVFGSESDDLDGLKKLVEVQETNPDFDSLVKVYLRMGYNYPTALSKALKDLTGTSYQLPNDILGISYLKAISKFKSSIIPHTIKRTTRYHDKTLQKEFSSATSIRVSLEEGIDVSGQVPSYVMKYLQLPRPNLTHYYSFYQYKILTESDFANYPFMDPGLGQKLKKQVLRQADLPSLIQSVKSRNTTYSKLSRSLLYLLCGYTKEKQKQFQEVSYLRLLGFSTRGQTYLRDHKKEMPLPLISKYKRGCDPMLTFEYQTTEIYAFGYPRAIGLDIIQKETAQAPIRKDEKYERND